LVSYRPRENTQTGMPRQIDWYRVNSDFDTGPKTLCPSLSGM